MTDYAVFLGLVPYHGHFGVLGVERAPNCLDLCCARMFRTITLPFLCLWGAQYLLVSVSHTSSLSSLAYAFPRDEMVRILPYHARLFKDYVVKLDLYTTLPAKYSVVKTASIHIFHQSFLRQTLFFPSFIPVGHVDLNSEPTSFPFVCCFAR